MFAKLVKEISLVQSTAEINEVCEAVDTAYQLNQIGWQQHQILFAILGMLMNGSVR